MIAALLSTTWMQKYIIHCEMIRVFNQFPQAEGVSNEGGSQINLLLFIKPEIFSSKMFRGPF